MAYLFFDADRKTFDDGEGGEVSLGQHLDHVASGGTPESFDSVETDSRSEAMEEARASDLHTYVVDESNYRVVGEVNS